MFAASVTNTRLTMIYAAFDGFGIFLRAPRENGDHVVYLEPDVWRALTEFVDRNTRSRG